MIFGVKNRDDAERGLALAEPYVMISISCPRDPAKIPAMEHCGDILRLEFDDLDQPVHLIGGGKVELFNRQHAQAILEFFEKYRGMVDYMIVHCDAGISRSPAVAAALTKITGGLDHDFFKKYYPNRRVYSLLMAEFFNREDN